jgi:hypothetical protein
MSMVRWLACGCAFALLVACQHTEPTADATTDATFRAAVQDARVAEPSEVVTTLTPIVPSNEGLKWRTTRLAGGDSVREVKMVTWTGPGPLPGTNRAPQAGQSLGVTDVVWVTAAPQIRQFCRSLDARGAALDRRLRQRLGLRPDDRPTRFVELWVRPSDLARPCPDPAITDRECERHRPRPTSLVTVDSTYRAWFQQLRATTYGPDGYPWTRLGYTYDWHPGSDEVGTSEFIVWPDATVEVHAVTSTDAYCK